MALATIVTAAHSFTLSNMGLSENCALFKLPNGIESEWNLFCRLDFKGNLHVGIRWTNAQVGELQGCEKIVLKLICPSVTGLQSSVGDELNPLLASKEVLITRAFPETTAGELELLYHYEMSFSFELELVVEMTMPLPVSPPSSSGTSVISTYTDASRIFFDVTRTSSAVSQEEVKNSSCR